MDDEENRSRERSKSSQQQLAEQEYFFDHRSTNDLIILSQKKWMTFIKSTLDTFLFNLNCNYTFVLRTFPLILLILGSFTMPTVFRFSSDFQRLPLFNCV